MLNQTINGSVSGYMQSGYLCYHISQMSRLQTVMLIISRLGNLLSQHRIDRLDLIGKLSNLWKNVLHLAIITACIVTKNRLFFPGTLVTWRIPSATGYGTQCSPWNYIKQQWEQQHATNYHSLCWWRQSEWAVLCRLECLWENENRSWSRCVSYC